MSGGQTVEVQSLDPSPAQPSAVAVRYEWGAVRSTAASCSHAPRGAGGAGLLILTLLVSYRPLKQPRPAVSEGEDVWSAGWLRQPRGVGRGEVGREGQDQGRPPRTSSEQSYCFFAIVAKIKLLKFRFDCFCRCSPGDSPGCERTRGRGARSKVPLER